MENFNLTPVTEKYLKILQENPTSARLLEAGEPYAAAIVLPDKTPMLRYSLGTALFFMYAKLTPYEGGRLYPNGMCLGKNEFNGYGKMGMMPEFSFSYWVDFNLIGEKVPEARPILEEDYYKVHWVVGPHTVGGNGYTHSFLNYRRILAEGLKGYRNRVNALPEGEFKDAMTILLDGIDCYRLRCLELLRQNGGRQELIEALEWVPMNTPRNIYEAVVAWNFMYYVDNGCDDPGGMDRALLPYWNGEDIVDLLHEFFTYVDQNDGWSMPLGPRYNGLTVQCIKAIHHLRRPQMQLLVTEDMPEEIWQAVYDALATSAGQPALYNWDSYKREFAARIPEVTEEDLEYLAFGGCTETMIEGLSNVGSDDAGVNAALVFDGYFREQLSKAPNFDDFLEGFIVATEEVIDQVCADLEEYRKTRAEHHPQPIRTLFVDDCLDKQMDFNAGGARYNWSCVNVAGLINIIDSMAAIKQLVFEQKRYTPDEFIRLLDARDPELLARCAACPKHGNDDPVANELARHMSTRIYGAFEKHTCTPGGRYFAVSNQFTTYESAGFEVRATPDGRDSGEPLCDSCSAIAGRDKKGPTAALNSAASLRLDLVLGTPITNMRISKTNLPIYLKPLVQTFFQNGGVQLQVTCASRAELEDALVHPEKHENLIVRIGGYAEYFNRLSPVLKQSVIDRTEY